MEAQKQRYKDYTDNQQHKHLHKIRKLSIKSRAITVQQLEAVKAILDKDKKNTTDKVEREWTKRRKRRRLGLPHRRLKNGWMFLNPLKKLLPRRVRIDNYIPDYIYYLFNALILISASINFGVASAVQSLNVVLGQIGVISGIPMEDDIKFPLAFYGKIHALLNIYIMIIVFIGCNVVYGAIKEGLWIYFALMLGGIIFQAVMGYLLIGQDTCSEITNKAGEKFSEFVNNYYYSVPAIDEDGRKLYNPDGSEFIIRTYRESNIMDVFQRNGRCCGSSGFRDYFVKPNPAPPLWIPEVPQSCCAAVWNQNIYCAKEIPFDDEELNLKINQEGCKYTTLKICENSHFMLSYGAINMSILQLVLFFVCCTMMIYQLRQIRQMERPTHFHIPSEAINIALPVSEEAKTKRLIQVLSLDPDQIELSDELLEAINKIRRGLGLDNLGRKVFNYVVEPPVVLTEPPHKLNKVRDPPPENIYKVPIKNIAKELIRTRIDIFELHSLKPYYKGMFSATYEQENKAAKHKVMKELKRYANKYHTRDRFQLHHSATVRSAFAKQKSETKQSGRGSKTVTKVVSRKPIVKANPLGRSKEKNPDRN